MSDDDTEIRRHLRQATAALLETMERFAGDGRLDKVEDLAGKIEALSRLRNLPGDLRETMSASSEIALAAYRQKISDLLDLAALLSAGADAQLKTAILGLIDGLLSKARTVGASSEFVAETTGRIARCQPSAAAPDAPFEGVPLFSTAKMGREAFAVATVPDPAWRRRRYNKPPLTVGLLGASHVTRNWTERGFVLTDFSGSVTMGARLRATLRCDLAPGFEATSWVRVARCDPAIGLVAAEFEKESPIGQLVGEIAAAARNPA